MRLFFRMDMKKLIKFEHCNIWARLILEVRSRAFLNYDMFDSWEIVVIVSTKENSWNLFVDGGRIYGFRIL